MTLSELVDKMITITGKTTWIDKPLGIDRATGDEIHVYYFDRHNYIYFNVTQNRVDAYVLEGEPVRLKESVSDKLDEVYPNKGESKKDFIGRFMSATKNEYPDRKQRYAVALSYWDRKNEDLTSVEENELSGIDKFIEDIYQLRKDSIANEGEYSIGNLIFKEFRSRGYLDKLKELKNKLESKKLSLEEDINNKSVDEIDDMLKELSNLK